MENMNSNQIATEILRCRFNILYWIDNYVLIPEAGGSMKYKSEKMHKKLKRFVKSTIKHKKTIMMASRQSGKALALDTPIPMPNGKWTIMGDLSPDDIILSNNGSPTKVIATTGVMCDHNCYEIEFDNGEKITADAEHLWEVSHSGINLSKEIKTTEFLFNKWSVIKNWKKATGFKIELSKPINNSDKEFILDPYLLGLWLGDGSNYDSRISISRIDYSEISLILEHKEFKISKFRSKEKYGQPNSGAFNVYKIVGKLKKLNLLQNKHIPREYFGGSFLQRLELLQGLMDSDGNSNKNNGSCEFYQKDEKLIDQVRELLSSLAIKSRKTYKIIDGEKYYTLRFTTNKFPIFKLSRKINYQKKGGNRQENYNFYIKDIKKVESVPVKCIQVDNPDGMFLCGKSMVPTHNSTVMGIVLLWSTLFFKGNRAVILNMKKSSAIENLKIIKFIHEHLPSWMKVPIRGKGRLQTYIEFLNGSRIDTFYVSAATGPEQIARGLTVPIIAIDECAFISKIEEAYGAASPAISKAREQALRNNFPTFTTIISTPQGTSGEGEFFYKMYTNAIDSDEIFVTNNNDPYNNDNFIDNYDEVVNNPSRNGFIKIDYLWYEDPLKDEKWFTKTKQDLNFDTRRINQEINCLFVGSSGCIFSDELLESLSPKKPIERINLPHMCELKLFEELDPLNYYIVSADPAASLTGDFSAVQIYDYRDFSQVGEYFNKLGTLSKLTDVIKAVINYLEGIVGDRIILAVERNGVGLGVVEKLEEDIDSKYSRYLYTNEPKKGIGITTTSKTKPIMVSSMYDAIVKNPNIIKSRDLINQLSVIERSPSGTVAAQRGSNDDLWMASCFASYVRKLSELEFESKIGMTNKQIKDKNKAIAESIFVDTKQKGTPFEEEILEKYINYYGDDESPEDNNSIIMPMLL